MRAMGVTLAVNAGGPVRVGEGEGEGVGAGVVAPAPLVEDAAADGGGLCVDGAAEDPAGDD
ncbi:hypothetical protein GCM10010149_55180 [Nonomuraea roseoviolacea subsp. roseoviolacea]